MTNILILGGDGYLGWPTAMYLSQKGYEVTVVDNYFRRKCCLELNIEALYQNINLVERAKIWYELTGKEIKVVLGDLREPEIMHSLFNGKVNYSWCIDLKYKGVPESVIHYAEQPSAPYSLISQGNSEFTLTNNLKVTHNLIWSVKEFSKETHIIKLGTMGEYGTPNIDIEEGWLDINHKGRSHKFLYPRQAGSIYHTSKIMDTDLLWYAVRMWGITVTDLMQGPVYGYKTEESEIDERLNTIFNYDDIFGTVINRFVVQAVCGIPLTVYGKGGQTRGYLNINDTLQCIYQAIKVPAKKSDLRIFNQIMETFTVNEIAEKISSVGTKIGYSVKINNIENPRKELESHYYNPTYQGLIDIGVKPHFLDEKAIKDLFKTVEKYKNNIRKDSILPRVKW
tara:strand:+ start:1358 stop:2545 length:1188 start_codon:yes stop_codon:yes gene_type:complete